mmetsp:Transcript_7876/g.19451  ORF Transcript_7876/g.19451 Transcript_7876/m.19451 type:complete len:92 (-) Transcript_7876:272-547(-)
MNARLLLSSCHPREGRYSAAKFTASPNSSTLSLTRARVLPSSAYCARHVVLAEDLLHVGEELLVTRGNGAPSCAWPCGACVRMMEATILSE